MTSLIQKMQLQRKESLTCKNFAVHISTCNICLTNYHKQQGASRLCEKGIELRDTHLETARKYGAVDTEFARRHAYLIA